VSDLHLEFRKNDLTFLIPSAPILCLLGDICVLGDDSDFDKNDDSRDFISVAFPLKQILHKFNRRTCHEEVQNE
jgi:hypothetical protein